MAICYLASNFRLHLTLLHDVYECVNKNEKKSDGDFVFIMLVYSETRTNIGIISISIPVLKYL